MAALGLAVARRAPPAPRPLLPLAEPCRLCDAAALADPMLPAIESRNRISSDRVGCASQRSTEAGPTSPQVRWRAGRGAATIIAPTRASPDLALSPMGARPAYYSKRPERVYVSRLTHSHHPSERPIALALSMAESERASGQALIAASCCPIRSTCRLLDASDSRCSAGRAGVRSLPAVALACRQADELRPNN